MSALIGPRATALFGVAFAVFLFLGVASIDFPAESTDQEVIAWWAKGANQDATLLSMAFVALSAIALTVFFSQIRDRLNAGGGTAGNPMFAVALGSAAMLLISAAIRGTIGNALTHDEPMPGVDTLRYLPELALTGMEVALMPAGIAILLGAWAMKHTRTFPVWAAWLGFVTGALTVVGNILVGPFIIPVVLIWALGTSVAVWRSPASEAAPAMQRVSATA